MIQRCHNPNDKDYDNYGARGIFVCDRWRNSFVDFMNDMGAPKGKVTIGRKDNDGPYTPLNCRWETHKAQANNRRNTVWLTIHGVTMPLSDWCTQVGIGPKAVLYRLKQGLSHEEAVFRPTNHGVKLT